MNVKVLIKHIPAYSVRIVDKNSLMPLIEIRGHDIDRLSKEVAQSIIEQKYPDYWRLGPDPKLNLPKYVGICMCYFRKSAAVSSECALHKKDGYFSRLEDRLARMIKDRITEWEEK